MSVEDKSMEVRIQEAAEKVFLEYGFSKTTMNQIAKEVGCNQALLHYYYRTKDKLFDKIFEDRMQFMLTNILTISYDDISLEDKIIQMIGVHFDFLKQNIRLVPFIFNEVSTNIEHLTSLVDKLKEHPKLFFVQLGDDLKKEIDNGVFRPITITNLILTIVSLNVTPFLVKSIFQKIYCLSDVEYDEVLEQRKKENIDIILARLKI